MYKESRNNAIYHPEWAVHVQKWRVQRSICFYLIVINAI